MISFKGYSINGWESEAGSITNIPAGKKKKDMVDFNLTLANISKAEEIDNIEYTLRISDSDSFDVIDEMVISDP